MVSEHFVAIFSALISFIGLLLVVIQIRESTRERRMEALHQIYDNNRELLALGFSHPSLFKILADDKDVDPACERRYLQLWLNQLSLIHSHLNHGSFDAEFMESLKRDIHGMMTLENMQRHWNRFSEFYPASFQRLVNETLRKIKPAADGS